jgi:hypothetical protein
MALQTCGDGSTCLSSDVFLNNKNHKKIIINKNNISQINHPLATGLQAGQSEF